MLLALASAIFLWSEPLGSRDHILLSQISDFLFHRLLRLAGSRWRYSIPPPHGCGPLCGPQTEHTLVRFVCCNLPVRCHGNVFSLMALPAHSGPWPLIQFRNHFSQTLGLLGRVTSSSQGLYLNEGQHKHRINAYTPQTSMP
jgi:hypothetical protein